MRITLTLILCLALAATKAQTKVYGSWWWKNGIFDTLSIPSGTADPTYIPTGNYADKQSVYLNKSTNVLWVWNNGWQPISSGGSSSGGGSSTDFLNSYLNCICDLPTYDRGFGSIVYVNNYGWFEYHDASDGIAVDTSNGIYPELHGGIWRLKAGKLNYTIVNDTATRNSIPFYSRSVGMIVKVLQTDSIYELKGGITNNNWFAWANIDNCTFSNTIAAIPNSAYTWTAQQTFALPVQALQGATFYPGYINTFKKSVVTSDRAEMGFTDTLLNKSFSIFVKNLSGALRLQSGGTNADGIYDGTRIYLGNSTSDAPFGYKFDLMNQTAAAKIYMMRDSMYASSGIQRLLTLRIEDGQSATAGFTGLTINRMMKGGTSSGNKIFAEFQKDSTTQAYIDSFGLYKTVQNLHSKYTSLTNVDKAYVDSSVASAALPSQTGNSGKILSTNGTSALWIANTAGTVSYPLFMAGSTSFTVPVNATNYAVFYNSSIGTSEKAREIIMPVSGTLKSLYVSTGGAQPADGTLTVTIRKGTNASSLSSTTVSVTIAANAAQGVYTDLVNSVAVSAGDILSIQVINTSTTTVSAPILSISAIIQ